MKNTFRPGEEGRCGMLKGSGRRPERRHPAAAQASRPAHWLRRMDVAAGYAVMSVLFTRRLP